MVLGACKKLKKSLSQLIEQGRDDGLDAVKVVSDVYSKKGTQGLDSFSVEQLGSIKDRLTQNVSDGSTTHLAKAQATAAVFIEAILAHKQQDTLKSISKLPELLGLWPEDSTETAKAGLDAELKISIGASLKILKKADDKERGDAVKTLQKSIAAARKQLALFPWLLKPGM